ncbi:MAG TPA: FAD-binding oxidoreductase [Solirubrobacteraceae bacterium]|jgi:glycine/D-amino acid oxidase-like deaminating enzyme|nr:FAD-binding oxidoreductase [Solirubrobacteraceae bacterium]
MPLEHVIHCDLCVVGGGYTGLWAALYAKEQMPGRSVVVLEGIRCGAGASSRNGGFLQYSLTHGIDNGRVRFPQEIRTIERLAMANFDELCNDLGRYAIDAEYEPTGELEVAVSPDGLQYIEESARLLEEFGQRAELLDRDAVQAEIHSPLYLGGLWQRSGASMVNPAKLADGLRQAALAAGVQIFEHSRVRKLGKSSYGVDAVTDAGAVHAAKVLLATSAYDPLVPAMRRYVAPVYDYALMTEPLTDAQLDSIGWKRRQGLGDSGYQFHYYRLSADNRILWGGYDAVYRYGGPVGPDLDDDATTFARLSRNFFTTFPQLEGLRFTHRWGGAIDTCSRFSVFFGRALRGRAVYALGYTGLGVSASRFGARTALDLLDGRATEASALELVRRRPIPFPPEPLRSAVIQFTRNRIAAADRTGHRGIWLRTLDRAGLGFDS